MQHRQPRHAVHGGACQVEVGTQANEIRIGELIEEQRFRVGSVAVIGCPRLRAHGQQQTSEKRVPERRARSKTVHREKCSAETQRNNSGAYFDRYTCQFGQL